MKKSYLFIAFFTLIISSCNKEEDGQQQNPDGLYENMVYLKTDIQVIRDIAYTTRPNFENLQYTSEKTKQTEKTQSTLSPQTDIYLPPNTAGKKQPLLVMIHGGGYSAGDKQAWENEAYTYARAGYICASLNYRLTQNGGNQNPQLRLYAVQCALEDIQNAIRYLKKNANTYFIDTSRIAVFGGSAGGVLSLLNAVEYDAAVGTNDHPGFSSKTTGSISTGASLVNDDAANQPGLIQYDAFDSPVLMFHAKENDSNGDGYTWTANAVPTQQAIIESDNTCTLIAQPNMTHTVVLELGGDYWQYIKPFLWEHLQIDDL